MTKILERKDIDEKYKWNIESLFASKEDWEKEYGEIESLLENVAGYKGKVTEDSDNLLNTIEEVEEVWRRLSNIYSYANMNLDVDTRNGEAQILSSRALSLYTEVSEKTSFLTPELLELNPEELERLIEDNQELEIYNQYFDNILRRKDHTLSTREEEILAQVDEIGKGFQQTFSMLNNADMTFPEIENEEGVKVELTQGNFIPFMESEDRRVRKDAFENFYSVYSDHKNTIASTLSGELKSNVFNASMRNYESTRQASLDANNIPEAVYDNLIESVHENLDTMYKYMDVRKKALDLDELHMYDIYTPIVQDVDVEYSYEEGVELIKEALVPLGEEYMEAMLNGFESRWVDVYENRGKRSGAYSGGSYDSNPFILLNYQGTLDNVFTTAHEMGHSMHSYLTRKYQPFTYGNYSIFLAEVASTTNEILLLNYMLDKTEDENERLYLINHYIESFRTTVFRQTMFAEFEMKINKHVEAGGALTADYLSESYKELNDLYYGPDIVSDEEIAIEWARIPHFYFNFYVFQYATGFSAAVDFANKILNGGQEEVDKYLEFLKSGSSDYAINILKEAGVDMTTKDPVDNAMKLFRNLVEEFDKLI